MIRTILLTIVCFALGVFSYALYKENYSINNYDECILKKMKSVDSETAAKSLKKACADKYKVSILDTLTFNKKDKEELSKDELEKTIEKLGKIMRLLKKQVDSLDTEEKSGK